VIQTAFHFLDPVGTVVIDAEDLDQAGNSPRLNRNRSRVTERLNRLRRGWSDWFSELHSVANLAKDLGGGKL
jgi:hypothetical protein